MGTWLVLYYMQIFSCFLLEFSYLQKEMKSLSSVLPIMVIIITNNVLKECLSCMLPSKVCALAVIHTITEGEW